LQGLPAGGKAREGTRNLSRFNQIIEGDAKEERFLNAVTRKGLTYISRPRKGKKQTEKSSILSWASTKRKTEEHLDGFAFGLGRQQGETLLLCQGKKKNSACEI